MSEDVLVFSTGDSIHVVLYIEHDAILAIGERMNELSPDAAMNGYNWDAFLRCYLAYHAPELLEDMDSDPEAGLYAAYYSPSPQNLEKAHALSALIGSLVENEDEIYAFLLAHEDEIDWE